MNEEVLEKERERGGGGTINVLILLPDGAYNRDHGEIGLGGNKNRDWASIDQLKVNLVVVEKEA